jgi:hypothetical protein
MERDEDAGSPDRTPDRPPLTDEEREALRGRIRALLASGQVTNRVRDGLLRRLPSDDEPLDFLDMGLDGTLDDLPNSIRRFFRGGEGSLGPFPGGRHRVMEDRQCSRT